MIHPSLLKRRKPIERRSTPIKRTTRIKARRTVGLPGLINKLDDLFAAYVKERDGNYCITCPGRPEGRNWHAGHFIQRRRMSLRFDPKNVHSQCGVPCNKFRHGAPAEYALAILDRYGEAELRRLMARKALLKKWTRPELERLIAAIQRSGAEFEMAYYETEL